MFHGKHSWDSKKWALCRIAIMGVRLTSQKAYKAIRDNGLLSRMRFRVYEQLHNHGPQTGSEVNYSLRCGSGHKRLSELKELGVVEEIGTRPCRITGENAIVWAVNDRLPKSLQTTAVRRPTKKQLAQFLAEMRAVYRELQSQGKAFSPEFVAVMQWLSSLARKAIR